MAHNVQLNAGSGGAVACTTDVTLGTYPTTGEAQNCCIYASQSITVAPTPVVEANPLYVLPAYPSAPATGTASAGATSNVATLAAVSGKTTHIQGFAVTGLGATSATSVQVAVTDGTWTLNFTVPVPAGVTTGITPLILNFHIPLAASAQNTAITVTVPSFGAGNTVATVSAWGYTR